jgi:hypothetical protein
MNLKDRLKKEFGEFRDNVSARMVATGISIRNDVLTVHEVFAMHWGVAQASVRRQLREEATRRACAKLDVAIAHWSERGSDSPWKGLRCPECAAILRVEFGQHPDAAARRTVSTSSEDDSVRMVRTCTVFCPGINTPTPRYSSHWSRSFADDVEGTLDMTEEQRAEHISKMLLNVV